MTGEQIFNSYMAKLEADTLTAAERKYFQILMSASMVISDHELYDLIEQADRTGQVLELVHPIPFDQGYSEPSGVRLNRECPQHVLTEVSFIDHDR